MNRSNSIVASALGLMLVSSAVAAPQATPPSVSPLELQAAPIPEVGKGAPLYTSEELQTVEKQERRESINTLQGPCMGGSLMPPPKYETAVTLPAFYYNLYLTTQKVSLLAGRAAQASETAALARAQASADPSKTQASLDAELARQTAVNAYVEARRQVAEWKADINDLIEISKRFRLFRPTAGDATEIRAEMGTKRIERAAKGGAELEDEAPDSTNLSLVNVASESQTDSKGAFVQVSGQIHNPGAKSAPVPGLVVNALDQGGRKLSAFTADPDSSHTIPPGGDVGFSYAFRPSPKRAVGFSVTFAGEAKNDETISIRMFCKG